MSWHLEWSSARGSLRNSKTNVILKIWAFNMTLRKEGHFSNMKIEDYFSVFAKEFQKVSKIFSILSQNHEKNIYRLFHSLRLLKMWLKFGHFIEYNQTNIFLQKSCTKWGKETSSRPLFFFWKNFIRGQIKLFLQFSPRLIKTNFTRINI